MKARWYVLATLTLGATSCSGGCNHESAEPHAVQPVDDNTVLLTKEQVTNMQLKIEKVDLQDVDDTVVASGKVSYDDQRVSHVFSPVTGKVVKVFAQLGDHVNKGDPLVSIESPDIGVASSDVGKAKADLIAAEHDFQRQKDMLVLHAASQKDFETAADNFRRAKAEMERAEQKAKLFRLGEVTGQLFTLRSDIAGEVFMKGVSPGMEVSGQYSSGNASELYTVGEADKVWVLADVFELDIPRVTVGSKVVVNVASWPNRNFEGTVDWISGALDSNTHATKVRCKFDNPDRALKPEMFGTVKISVDAKKAVAVPRSAVIRLGEQTFAFVDRGVTADGKERFERLPVVIDEGEGSQWLTVSHGLNQGDNVVTSGALLLSGMQ